MDLLLFLDYKLIPSIFLGASLKIKFLCLDQDNISIIMYIIMYIKP